MRAGAEASLDVAADAIPPEASYISSQAFRETPAVEGLFKSWCRDGEFTQLEAIGVAAAVDEFDRTGADITRWPAHLREARLKALEEAFNADPQGRQTLARVRRCSRRCGGRRRNWRSFSTRLVRALTRAWCGRWPGCTEEGEMAARPRLKRLERRLGGVGAVDDGEAGGPECSPEAEAASLAALAGMRLLRAGVREPSPEELAAEVAKIKVRLAEEDRRLAEAGIKRLRLSEESLAVLDKMREEAAARRRTRALELEGAV